MPRAWLCSLPLMLGCRTTPPADLVLFNGKVITVDSTDRIAEAIAISGGRIVAVGTNAEIRASIGPKTDTVDLAGRTVTPGLLDAHAHFASGAIDRRFVLDLSYPGVKSVADIVAAIAGAGLAAITSLRGAFSWLEAAVAGVLGFMAVALGSGAIASSHLTALAFLSACVALACRAILVRIRILPGA